VLAHACSGIIPQQSQELPLMSSPEQVTLAVLAGGEGSRLGRPKAQLRIDGTPLLQWLLRRWNWPGPTMLVTSPGRAHPPGSDGFTAEVTDPAPDLGPLRGVLTALDHLSTPICLVTTVDMPLLIREQFEWYLQQLNNDPDCLGLMASRQAQSKDLIEPFPSIYRAEAITTVRRHFDAGMRSTYSLQKQPGVRVIAAPAGWGEKPWMNLNTTEDLNAFGRLGLGSAGF
jgi:molybdenum cofactor guanylyltransferase